MAEENGQCWFGDHGWSEHNHPANIKGLKDFKAKQQAKLCKVSEQEANAINLTYTDDEATVVTTNNNERKRSAQADEKEVDKLIQAVNNSPPT